MGLVFIIRKERGGQNVRIAAFRGQSLMAQLERGDSTKLTPSWTVPPGLQLGYGWALWPWGKLPSLWLISPHRVDMKDANCRGFRED